MKNSHVQIRLVNSPEIDSDPYDLDNRTYGLMSWGDGASGKAMTASGSVNHTLDVDPLTVMSNSGGDMIYVSKSIEDITMWTFEWLEDDKYSLKATVDGEEKYLNITPQGLSMSDDPVPIQVVPGTGARAGQICLKKDGTTLTYNSTTGESSAGSFGVGGIAGSEWLYLLEPSTLTNDYSLTHTAEKVNGERVQEVEVYLTYIGKLDLPDAGISLDTASPEQQAAQREKRAYHRQYYHEKRKPKKEAQTAAG